MGCDPCFHKPPTCHHTGEPHMMNHYHCSFHSLPLRVLLAQNQRLLSPILVLHITNFEYTLTLSSCPSAIIKKAAGTLLCRAVLVPHRPTHLPDVHDRIPILEVFPHFQNRIATATHPSNPRQITPRASTITSLYQLRPGPQSIDL